MWPFRKNSAPLGTRGETLAAKHLRHAGYHIVGRNIRCGRHEIDIIARRGDTLVFVEVRTRADMDPVPPEDTVNAQKRRHILSAARWYISRHPEPDVYYRFDVVAVILPENGEPQVTWYPDAFPGA